MSDKQFTRIHYMRFRNGIEVGAETALLDHGVEPETLIARWNALGVRGNWHYALLRVETVRAERCGRPWLGYARRVVSDGSYVQPEFLHQGTI